MMVLRRWNVLVAVVVLGCLSSCSTGAANSRPWSPLRVSLLGVSYSQIETQLIAFCREAGEDAPSIDVAFSDDKSYTIMARVMEELGYVLVLRNFYDDGLIFSQCTFQKDPVAVCSIGFNLNRPLPKIIGLLWEDGVPISWAVGGMTQYLEIPKAQLRRFLLVYKDRIEEEIGGDPRFSLRWEESSLGAPDDSDQPR